MNPEWVYHFLIGYDQNLAPSLVAFCVNTNNDCVVILPYTRMLPNPNAPFDENDPPIRSASLGSLQQINVRSKSEARSLWDSLCNDPKFQMKPTEFKDVYPNYKYSTNWNMSSWPSVLEFNHKVVEIPSITGKTVYKVWADNKTTPYKSDRIYSNTNYALEA
jgi:hypothetical protein